MIDWQLNGLEAVNPRRRNKRGEKQERRRKRKGKKDTATANNAPVSEAPINANHG